MTLRRFGLGLLCVAVVLLGVAWVAGRQSLVGTGGPARSLDAVRLGPEQGQPIAGYLAGLPARLPPDGAAATPALVQFADELDVSDVARLLGSAVPAVLPATAVFRVPLPRVQTALRFQPLDPVDDADPVAATQRRLDLARRAAQRAAQLEAGRLTGRAAALARYEAGVLGGAYRCRCVLAVLVVGDRAALSALSGRPGVRAVDAAPVGTPVSGVALAPLLPEQTDVVGPVPDDGPVPATGAPG